VTLSFALDAASVFVFALTGALAASRAQLDIVGFLFFAALTAVGGGTVRDLLLDRNPVFWINQPAILFIAAAAAVLVFFSAHLVESRARWLAWLDAAALSIAVPAGLVLRDVVANEVPMVLRQGELYMTAAFLGALAGWYVSGYLATGPALIVAGLVTFFLRAGSLAFGWGLPVYRSRPPR
jgi:uncharacterized membrane protein YeiH